MPISNIVRLQTKMLRLQTKNIPRVCLWGLRLVFIDSRSFQCVERYRCRDTVCPATDIFNAGSIEEKLRPRTKSSKEENRKSSPAAQLGRKSKFHSAHVTPNHLEILNAKFYYLATSNLGD